jgi:CRISPR-associated protein Cas1
MIKRVIDVSEQAYLHVQNRQLCIDKQGETVAQIAIEDLGILILQHPAIVITQAVITQCQKNNVAILFCDERHLPISITLPLWEGHSLHTRVLQDQLSVTEPTRKRLWQQVVKHKIAEQALTLEQAGISAKALHRLKDKVKSGDPENCEAQAARKYWTLLMGKEFRRDTEAEGINSLLNYGYAVVRAMTARALVGTGLHPAIGIYHKNQYNGLCLADDIMEPFRPWVDWLIYQLAEENKELTVCKESKQVLLGLLAGDVLFEGRKMPLMVAAHSLVARLKLALTDRRLPLIYPQRLLY